MLNRMHGGGESGASALDYSDSKGALVTENESENEAQAWSNESR